MRWPTLLFDFDGTLIDSIELILESYRHTMRVHRGATPPDDLFLAGLGTPLRVQFRSFTDDAEELAAMIQTYRRWNIDNHDAMVSAYPGALEAVKTLRSRGYRMGIVTSKNLRGLLRGLTLCGFEGLFDSFVTADSMDASKPHPAPVLACITELGGTPESSLFIGDSPHDIAAGRAAGTATAACLWGPFPRSALEAERPDHWLNSFDELLALLA
ncbi:MAG TPA: HAD-IA family hydrolase [Gemmatimonadales bacterium]|nr:HAD-IA family hydrolase [Gemmatimonadales bacterium]